VKVHAIVTSYEVAMMEATELRKLEFEALVVDEGHRLKNSSSRCFVKTCIRCRHAQRESRCMAFGCWLQCGLGSDPC